VNIKRKRKGRPRCILIAGPNGVGKTTFAREYLPTEARVLNFVNAVLIAGGLSPLKPELAAVAAAGDETAWLSRRNNLLAACIASIGVETHRRESAAGWSQCAEGGCSATLP
jgi:predicted ABC-type ATPase